jgi:hypothetical protein
MALKEEQGLANWEIATAKKLVSEYRRRHRILQREEFDDLMHPGGHPNSPTYGHLKLPHLN